MTTTLIKLLLLLVIFHSSNVFGNDLKDLFNSNKYDYQASESAPFYYPMKIISGRFLYHDGSGYLSVPSMVIVAKGWDVWRSSHVTGEKYRPLPSKLPLVYFSFTENKFFKANFDLPLKK